MGLKAQILALKLKGRSNAQIGQAIGVCKATVSYHLHHLSCEDGRSNRHRKLDALAPAVERWIHAHHPLADVLDNGAVYVRTLHTWLCQEHGYDGSHRSVVRYVQTTYPMLRLRPYSHAEA